MTTVLVIAAHPDDEVLGPGGTIARHTRGGDEVHTVVVADGATSRYEDHMVGVLAVASEKVAGLLGVTDARMLGLPDQRLDSLALLEVTQQVQEIVAQVHPTIVYTHCPWDVNADHGVVSRATWTACRPYVAPQLTRFAVFETPSSTEWGWPAGSETFLPNLFVDITSTLEDKLTAMSFYESELRDYPHPRSLRALRERAAYWGSRVSRTAVEPFQILREVT